MNKAQTGAQATALEEIPNVGPSVAASLRQVGIRQPVDPKGRDPYPSTRNYVSGLA